MPQGRYDHTAAAMGGKIYVTGGECDTFPTDHDENQLMVNSVYVYDPQANTWAQLASMDTARRNQASAAVGGKLYVFGGVNSGERLSTAEVYDPASDSWVQGPSLTSAPQYSVAAAV